MQTRRGPEDPEEMSRRKRTVKHFYLSLRLLLLLCTMLLAGVVLPLQVTAVKGLSAPRVVPQSAVVRAGSGSILQVGSPITLPVEAVDVQDLGAATVVVGYDPAVLQVTGCQRNRAFDVGLCNTQFDRDGDSVADAVGFNAVSMDGLSAGEGAPLNLVDIAWGVVGTPGPGMTSTLVVEVQTFTESDGYTSIDVSAENGQVTVGITQVRVSDIMRVAADWGQPATGGTAQLDLVLDGIIDVQDVSALAEHWRGTWP